MSEFTLTPEQNEAVVKASGFFESALEAAVTSLLWSEGHDSAIPSQELMDQVICDLAGFLFLPEVREAVDSLKLSGEDVGHNFYLSANGHGTGFWDRGWGQAGDVLNHWAKTYEIMTYVSDGKVYP